MDEPKLEIRRLLPTDLNKGFIELLSELSFVDLTFNQTRQTVYNKRLKNNNLITWVVVDYSPSLEEKIVGTCSLYIEQKFIHRGGKVGHLEDVVVAKTHQKQQIGYLLVKTALDWAKMQGCYKCILNCRESVAGFYEKLGFYQDGISMRNDFYMEYEE